MGGSYRLSDGDQDALIQGKLVAVLQLVAVLVICFADREARRVEDHDAVVEGVKFEVAILPALLLPAHVMGKEAAELEDGRGVLRGGDGGGVGGPSQRVRHGAAAGAEINR